MIEVEEAVTRIVATVAPLPAETVALAEAAGRILAENVTAPISLPGFDNSAMDGYALRAADVRQATADNSVTLHCVGTAPAGTHFQGSIQPGTCVRIFTGSPVPAGADAVVMQEDTRASGDQIAVLDGVKPWENIRLCGEDVKAGSVLATSGTRVTAAVQAVIGATGVSHVRVGRRPLIGLLATGSELKEAGEPLAPGQIYESNRLALATLVRAAGGTPCAYPLVPDSLDATRHALSRAFSECDAVITTGGASVGDHDYVKAALESLGGTLDFWKVSMKPGKPFVFGRLGGKSLFGLPGNPVSAFVTFLLLVRPAILKWQGATDLALPSRPAHLAEPLHNRGPRPHYVRVHVDGAGQVRSTGTQASHMLSSLAPANGLLRVPGDTLLPGGQAVTVLALE